MGNNQFNKRAVSDFTAPPGSEKIGPKIQKPKNINTSTATHKQKKQQSPRQTKKKDKRASTPTMMMRCTGQYPVTDFFSKESGPQPRCRTPAPLMALSPRSQRCHPVPMAWPSSGGEPRLPINSQCCEHTTPL